MKKYRAYKHMESNCIWVPFWKLEKITENRTECQEMATSGIIIREMTPERKEKCKIVEISKTEFEKSTQNIKMMKSIELGGIWERYGLLFTCTDLYDLSDEYRLIHNLYHRTRVIENSPLHEYGPISYGIN